MPDRSDRPTVAPLPRALRRFVRRWGWRAYALPVLAVVTVVAIATGAGAGGTPTSPVAVAPGASAPPVAASSQQLKVDDGGAGAQTEVLASDALPDGAPYTQQGAGTFHTLPGTGPVVGSGPLRTYTVDVEDGVTGVDEQAFAAVVDTTLSDPRSWIGRAGSGSLQRVDTPTASWHISLTSSLTVRDLCGYEQAIETSCWTPDDDRVVLNVARWVRGDVAYIGDLDAYHVYMVNHENGHALGHLHVYACLAGGLAPVMMQQTITLTATDGTICQANPWPYPPGVDPGPDPTGPAAPTA